MSIASPLTYDSYGNACFTLHIILKNVGRSPATNIYIDTDVSPLKTKTPEEHTIEQKKIAELAQNERPSDGFAGYVLFPEGTRTIDKPLRMLRDEIDESTAEIGPRYTYFSPVICRMRQLQFYLREGAASNRLYRPCGEDRRQRP